MARRIASFASATRMPGSSRAWSIDSPNPESRTPNPESRMYIELHAASAFSFLQGASLPETLVERAAALGYPALALLDADGVYGAPRFHKAAKQAGLRAIVGAELTIENTIGGSTKHVGGSTKQDPPYAVDKQQLGSVGRVLSLGPANAESSRRSTWRLPVLVS